MRCLRRCECYQFVVFNTFGGTARSQTQLKIVSTVIAESAVKRERETATVNPNVEPNAVISTQRARKCQLQPNELRENFIGDISTGLYLQDTTQEKRTRSDNSFQYLSAAKQIRHSFFVCKC